MDQRGALRANCLGADGARACMGLNARATEKGVHAGSGLSAQGLGVGRITNDELRNDESRIGRRRVYSERVQGLAGILYCMKSSSRSNRALSGIAGDDHRLHSRDVAVGAGRVAAGRPPLAHVAAVAQHVTLGAGPRVVGGLEGAGRQRRQVGRRVACGEDQAGTGRGGRLVRQPAIWAALPRLA